MATPTYSFVTNNTTTTNNTGDLLWTYTTPSTDSISIPMSSIEPSEASNLLKTNVEKRIVFGWANVPFPAETVSKGYPDSKVDLQGDMVDLESLEDAAYEFVLSSRTGGLDHTYVAGRLVESVVITEEKLASMGIPENLWPSINKGWWVGFKIDNDEIWELVKSGEYSMFSIGGRAAKEAID